MDAAAAAMGDVAAGVIGVDDVAVGAAVFLMLPCALAVRIVASGDVVLCAVSAPWSYKYNTNSNNLFPIRCYIQ